MASFPGLLVSFDEFNSVLSPYIHSVIDWVQGLDPAFPGYSLENTADRLDVTDAKFVDIMHTNSGTLLTGGLSFLSPIGHVDFWPNGGETQPVRRCYLSCQSFSILTIVLPFLGMLIDRL